MYIYLYRGLPIILTETAKSGKMYSAPSKQPSKAVIHCLATIAVLHNFLSWQLACAVLLVSHNQKHVL